MPVKGPFVDVLIVGAGPAGCMLAASLSRNGIKARVIDKRATGLIAGHADGINPRSLEIFGALDIAPEILRQANESNSGSFWAPGSDGGIQRKDILNLGENDFIDFGFHLLNQGRIEKIVSDSAKLYSDIEIERGVLPLSLKVDPALAKIDDAYPIEVVLQHLEEGEASVVQLKAHTKDSDHTPHDGLFRSNLGPTNHTEQLHKKVALRTETQEIVRAKYVVGCDGAWSWTRNQIGVEMVGDKSDFVWGAIDIIPITDFPDAREVGIIQSAVGSILWIPREFGLVRLYTQLQEVKPGEDGVVDRSKITPDHIFEQAKKILAPYSIEYRYCDWWTAYQVGQRVGTSYHDPTQRVFLAGDAVHTHSPKEGLGMNTSMQDAFNLGWKLAAVINGESPKSILDTYQPERRPIAEELIAVDKAISRTFSEAPADAGRRLEGLYKKQANFMSGVAFKYTSSKLIATAGEDSDSDSGVETTSLDIPSPLTKPKADSGNGSLLAIGARLPPWIVRHHTGGHRRSLLKLAPFDGRWRLLVFAGDVTKPAQLARVNALGEALSDPKTGLLRKKHVFHRSRNVPFPYALNTESGRRVQMAKKEVPLIDVHAIHSKTRVDLTINEFHDCYWPLDQDLGHAYDKIHYANDVYDGCGISKETGCMVLARPDQHIAWIGTIDDLEGLTTFAKGCILFD